MKSLVLCYSLGGRTALIGKAIAEELGGDFEAVEELEQRKGIGGMVRGAIEALTGKMTAIQKIKANVASYDQIVIGAPVWAGKPAPAVNMLVEMIPFKNKSISVYATMGSSSPGKTLKILAENIMNKEGQLTEVIAIKTGGVANEELIRRGREFAKTLAN